MPLNAAFQIQTDSRLKIEDEDDYRRRPDPGRLFILYKNPERFVSDGG